MKVYILHQYTSNDDNAVVAAVCSDLYEVRKMMDEWFAENKDDTERYEEATTTYIFNDSYQYAEVRGTMTGIYTSLEVEETETNKWTI